MLVTMAAIRLLWVSALLSFRCAGWGTHMCRLINFSVANVCEKFAGHLKPEAKKDRERERESARAFQVLDDLLELLHCSAAM